MDDKTSPRPNLSSHLPEGRGGSASKVTDHFSPPVEPDEIGRLGDYRILKALGDGGMGHVFLAEDTRLKRPVALKLMAPILAGDEKSRVRFLREARAAASIQHENVVVIYEVNEANGLPYIAMERLKGMSLEDYFEKKNKLPGLSQTLRIAKEMLAGLAAAHDRGLVHRDIKPGNIWLEAPTGRVRLLDFGLAVQLETDRRVTSEGVIVGTPSYMAPEQARGGVVDHRADLFSLGVVLYRLCTGKLPFNGPNGMAVLVSISTDIPTPVRTHNPSIPIALDQLVQQLLAKNPNERPQSAANVIAALSAVVVSGSPEPPGLVNTQLAVNPGTINPVPSWLNDAVLEGNPHPPSTRPNTESGTRPDIPPRPLTSGRPPQPSPQPAVPDWLKNPGEPLYPTLIPPTTPSRISPDFSPPDRPAMDPSGWVPPPPIPPVPVTSSPQPPPAPPSFPYPVPGYPPPPAAPAIQISIDNKSESSGNELYLDHSSRARPPKSDPAGLASLIIGIVSFVSLSSICCGTYFLTAPLALTGLIVGMFGRGGYRLAGMILNGFVLIPGLIIIFIGTAITASILAMFSGASKPLPPSKSISNENIPNVIKENKTTGAPGPRR